MLRYIRIFSCTGIAFVLGSFWLASPALAQSGPPTLIKHLRTELQSDEADRQVGALIDVISLSLCNSSCEIALRSMTNRKISIENETGAGKIVDLDILTPDLVRTYQRGPADGQRLLALQALINIGNMSALEQIANAKGQQSKAVQDATNKSLIAFYLGKYPELEGRTNRRSVLSISEVQRAESVRLKMTKRAGRN